MEESMSASEKLAKELAGAYERCSNTMANLENLLSHRHASQGSYDELPSADAETASEEVELDRSSAPAGLGGSAQLRKAALGGLRLQPSLPRNQLLLPQVTINDERLVEGFQPAGNGALCRAKPPNAFDLSTLLYNAESQASRRGLTPTLMRGRSLQRYDIGDDGIDVHPLAAMLLQSRSSGHDDQVVSPTGMVPGSGPNRFGRSASSVLPMRALANNPTTPLNPMTPLNPTTPQHPAGAMARQIFYKTRRSGSFGGDRSISSSVPIPFVASPANATSPAISSRMSYTGGGGHRSFNNSVSVAAAAAAVAASLGTLEPHFYPAPPANLNPPGAPLLQSPRVSVAWPSSRRSYQGLPPNRSNSDRRSSMMGIPI